MKTYMINEVFYSPQGEGARAGEPSFFVRFTGCNLRCDIEPSAKSPGGFRCDTEFESGRMMTTKEIYDACNDLHSGACWMVLTGGEPALQLDQEFVDVFHELGFKLAVETNGTIELPNNLDWICVSPKGAEHTLRQLVANEVKYVRAYGQGIPKTRVRSPLKYISPAFDGHRIDPRTMEWCVNLVKDNPDWRLSVQQHHAWGVR